MIAWSQQPKCTMAYLLTKLTFRDNYFFQSPNDAPA
jgi:hypothetical protein